MSGGLEREVRYDWCYITELNRSFYGEKIQFTILSNNKLFYCFYLNSAPGAQCPVVQPGQHSGQGRNLGKNCLFPSR